jgi:hypothetical protein
MVYEQTTIVRDEGSSLQIGFVECITAPTVMIDLVRTDPEHAVLASVSFDAVHLDEVIGALQRIRETLRTGA